jgi:hypothetical protein
MKVAVASLWGGTNVDEETGELPSSLFDQIVALGYYRAQLARSEERIRAIEAEHGDVLSPAGL